MTNKNEKWFAWFPVISDTKKILFLKYVIRRTKWKYNENDIMNAKLVWKYEEYK